MITQQDYNEIIEFVNNLLDGKEIIKDDNFYKVLNNAKLLEEILISNVRADNFDIYYQPKFENGKYTKSAEALFRSKDSFNVRPDVAFTLFKIFGHEQEVVLKQIERITDDLTLFTKHIDKDFNVSVNVAIDCLGGSLANKITNMITTKQLNYNNIGIEILESENFENLQNHSEVINYLHEKGVGFSIDDFGTRNANFSALKQLPFDVIKIDSIYLKKARETNDYSIICNLEKAIHEMYPNAKIVVEGVEEIQDIEHLNKTEIPQSYQGYYYAKPMKSEELVERYKNQNKPQNNSSNTPNGKGSDNDLNSQGPVFE